MEGDGFLLVSAIKRLWGDRAFLFSVSTSMKPLELAYKSSPVSPFVELGPLAMRHGQILGDLLFVQEQRRPCYFVLRLEG